MNHNIFFLLAIVAISLISYQQANAQQQETYRGKNYIDIDHLNGIHTWTGGLPTFLSTGEKDLNNKPVFVQYRFYDKPNYVTFESGTVSWTFSKDSCTVKLYTNGRVNSTAIPTIENISYTLQEALNGTDTWTATEHNSMPCEVTITDLGDGIKLIAKQGNNSIKFKEIEFIAKGGEDLVVTLRSPETIPEKSNYRYGFAESQVKSQDVIIKSIKHDLNIQNSIKFDSSDFTKQIANKKIDMPIITKNNFGTIEYNTENSKHGTLSDVEIKKYSTTKLQTIINYHKTNVLPVGQRLEIDPTYSSNNPTEDGIVETNANTGAACPSASFAKVTGSTSISSYVPTSAASEKCQRAYIEYDISSIPSGVNVTDTDFTYDIDVVTNGRVCDYGDLATQPSITAASTVWSNSTSGTVFANDSTVCQTTGDNRSIDLGALADNEVEAQLGVDWFAFYIRFDSEARDGSAHDSNFLAEESASATPKPTLTVVYATPCTPNAPTGLTAITAPISQIDLNWTNSANCTNNAVQVDHATVTGTWATIYSGAVKTTHNDTGLATNTIYNFRVRVQSDSLDWGAFTANATATTKPAAPTSLTAVAESTTKINLTWLAPVGGNGVLTGYKIERQVHTVGTCTGGSFTTLVANTGTTAVTYSDTAASVNTCYTYRVSAINSGGTGAASNTAQEPTKPYAVIIIGYTALDHNTITITWTAPQGIKIGYQINSTTPFGNPQTKLVNNTGTNATTYAISGLTATTQYSIRVSAWTNGGTNATGKILNVTTLKDFSVGSLNLTQTNPDIIPIRFTKTKINSTAMFLNITYSSSYNLSCDLHYKFGQTNKTYNNMTGTTSGNTKKSAFTFTNVNNEIIDVNCWNRNAGPMFNNTKVNSTNSGRYIITQTDFILLKQVQNFRTGVYGTQGNFGIIDFITLIAIIFSMVGMNRVNETVGIIFSVAIIGSLAFFGIIGLPTIIFSVLALVIMLVITTTKKD